MKDFHFFGTTSLRNHTIIFDMNNEYKVVPNISCDKEEENAKKGADKATYGLLEFERPVVIVPGCKGT